MVPTANVTATPTTAATLTTASTAATPVSKENDIPVVDLAGAGAAAAIDAACRAHGFFSIANHGVPTELQDSLARLSAQFFARPAEEKLEIRMSRGGRAWRGYFPVGGELTSGKPDRKEGIYLGQELPSGHPAVKAGTPLHGRNLFPAEPPELRDVVLRYIDEMTRLGHRVVSLLSEGLGLGPDAINARLTSDPLVLLRVFHYPADVTAAGLIGDGGREEWGVGEHTDYGLLTLLKQDDVSGLQVKAGGTWRDVPPVPDTFVCNIGDMLERLTAGAYKSTPHRVRSHPTRNRLSFPVFFDPGFASRVEPFPELAGAISDDQRAAAARERWDAANPHAFEGTYGDYIMGKVAKVFPSLFEGTIASS